MLNRPEHTPADPLEVVAFTWGDAQPNVFYCVPCTGVRYDLDADADVIRRDSWAHPPRTRPNPAHRWRIHETVAPGVARSCHRCGQILTRRPA